MTKLAPALLLLGALCACQPPEANDPANGTNVAVDDADNAVSVMAGANESANAAEPQRSILRPEVQLQLAHKFPRLQLQYSHNVRVTPC